MLGITYNRHLTLNLVGKTSVHQSQSVCLQSLWESAYCRQKFLFNAYTLPTNIYSVLLGRTAVKPRNGLNIFSPKPRLTKSLES